MKVTTEKPQNSSTEDQSNERHAIRIVVDGQLYARLKEECTGHGEVSSLVRKLLTKYLDMMEEAK